MDIWASKTGLKIDLKDRSAIYVKYGNWSQASIRQYLGSVKIPELVTQLYQNLLGRNLEPNAILSYVSGFLDNGLTVDILHKTIEESPERGFYLKKQKDMVKLRQSAKPLEELSHLKVSDSLKNINIKWIGPVGKTGYSQSVKAYVNMLFACGANVTFSMSELHTATEKPCEKDILLMSVLDRDIDYDIVVIEAVPNTWEPFIKAEREKKPNVKVVGLTLWEADTLHPAWIGPMNMCNAIIACSEWNKHIFMKSVNVPVYTLHNPIEYMADPSTSVDLGLNENEYVFYTINEWTARKGIEELIHCFLESFTLVDNVALYIKTSTVKQHVGEQYINEQKVNYPNPPRIILNTEDWSDENIVSLHSRGNCYISLCRAEGIGLGACEASLFGKPVIMSSYGGQQDYLKGVFFVSCSDEPTRMCSNLHMTHDTCENGICKHYPWYLPNSMKWGKPSLENAQSLIKFVFTNQELADSQARITCQYVKDMFNYKTIGNQAAAILCSILYS